MSFLVTGAKGGFGRILAQWLQQQANEPVWLTDIADETHEFYIKCDMGNADAIRALIKRVQPQRIFHLAGSFSNLYDLDYQINALSARHLCETLITEHCDARLILIGSAAEYGFVRPNENPVREDHVLQPVSIYGITKAMQTLFAVFYAQRYSIDVVVARLFNLNAPGLSERLFVGRMEQLIAQFKRKQIKHIEVGNLESQRDYIGIEEAIPQLLLIAEKGKAGEVYHVGSGQPVQIRGLLTEMLTASGLDMSVVREKRLTEGKIGNDIPIIYADMNKTKGLTGSPEETPR
jgi:nucleoside-diphosphate-sugar epimerase